MQPDRRWGWMWVAVGCGLLAIALVAHQGLPSAKWGDMDPASTVFAALGLLVAIVNLVVAWQRPSIDAEACAAWLTHEVGEAATRELQQLLGGDGQNDQADKAIDVEFVLLPTYASRAAGAEQAGSLYRVAAYYRQLRPQRLLITGAAGAGKTVLALRLMQALLNERTPADRIPVLLSAAAWDTSIPLPQWVAGHLVATFNLPARTAETLVKAGRILPVIDGLDEMDSDATPAYSSRAAHAIRALNTYLTTGPAKPAVIVTCRTDRYTALDHPQVAVRAQDAAHIQIRPVEPAAVQDFLETRVGAAGLSRWGPVLDAVDFHADGPLAQALSTPWRLTLAVTIYQERDPVTGGYRRNPAKLTEAALDTPDKIGDHLLAAYIPAVTRTASTAGRNSHAYTPGDINHWLTVLARHLHTNARKPPIAGKALSSTGIVLHELWPLAGKRPYTLAQALTGIPAFLFLVSVLLSVHARFRFTLAALGALLLTRMWVVAWPKPWHIDASVKTRGRYRAAMTTFGLFSAVTLALGVGLSSGWTAALIAGAAFGIAWPRPPTPSSQHQNGGEPRRPDPQRPGRLAHVRFAAGAGGTAGVLAVRRVHRRTLVAAVVAALLRAHASWPTRSHPLPDAAAVHPRPAALAPGTVPALVPPRRGAASRVWHRLRVPAPRTPSLSGPAGFVLTRAQLRRPEAFRRFAEDYYEVG
jgi:hypothetical protein